MIDLNKLIIAVRESNMTDDQKGGLYGVAREFGEQGKYAELGRLAVVFFDKEIINWICEGNFEECGIMEKCGRRDFCQKRAELLEVVPIKRRCSANCSYDNGL